MAPVAQLFCATVLRLHQYVHGVGELKSDLTVKEAPFYTGPTLAPARPS